MNRNAKKYVAYYRVSSQKQGHSGLGLEAQRQCVEDAVGLGGIIADFTEIETGRGSRFRPQLQAALDYCRQNHCTLVIARLDRLSRNVHFIFSLREAGVDFFCCDLPECNTLNLAIFAAMAQHESELISKRTKAALQAKKKRLGLAKLHNNLTRERREKGYRQRQEIARQTPANQRAIRYVHELRQAEVSLREVANRLNLHEYPTPRGKGKWHLSSVQKLLKLYEG